MFLQTIKGPFAEELQVQFGTSDVRITSNFLTLHQNCNITSSTEAFVLEHVDMLAYSSYTRVQVLHMILLEGNEQRWALKH